MLALLLTGCAGAGEPEKKQYTATFLTLFDTVTTIVGRAEREEDFQLSVQAIRQELERYHQLFDIYHDYEGLNNLKTVNDAAGIAPVTVDPAIIALLKDCWEYYDLTNGKVNVAMGSVLYLWHEARSDSFDDPANAHLPEQTALEEASAHVSIDALVIDEEAGTVFLTDPDARLDVGAVAKGWAAQRVSASAPQGLLISVGGNVCATGPKDENGAAWVVGVQDPDDGGNYLHTLAITGGSVVTSGDYQRNFAVDGQFYHHIIDPETLYPSQYWRSVTIVCADSGLADALSTALFLLPQAEGQALLDKTGASAMWVSREGEIFFSPGFETFLRT